MLVFPLSLHSSGETDSFWKYISNSDHVETSNRFAALETLQSNMGINVASENIKGECSQRKSWLLRSEAIQTTCLRRILKIHRSREISYMERLQGPDQVNGDNQNNARWEISRRNNTEYQKNKINELDTDRSRVLEFLKGNKWIQEVLPSISFSGRFLLLVIFVLLKIWWM
jgi:hypothetical protein